MTDATPSLLARLGRWLVGDGSSEVLLQRFCLAIIAIGIVLRVHDLSFPPHLTFDEHHFVKNAENYLAHRADWNDHPPLGKLLMVLGIRWLGDNAVGWRIVPLVCGCCSVALAYGIGLAAFRNRSAGYIAAALLALDGFFVAYSRTALLDGMLTAAVLAAGFLLLDARSWWHALLAAMFIGVAASIKWTGITLVVPFLFAVLVLGKAPRLSVLALAVVPVIYFAQYSVGLYLARVPYGVLAVYRETRRLFLQQAAATAFEHPLCSEWWWWLVMVKPIVMRFDRFGDRIRVMSSIGNPLAWFASTAAIALALLGLLAAGARAAWARVKRAAAPTGFFAERWQSLTLLLLLWLAPLLPWMLYGRDSYFYHYLPAYGFALCLLGGLIARLFAYRPWLGWAALVPFIVSGLVYVRFSAQIPVKEETYETLVFLKKWK